VILKLALHLADDLQPARVEVEVQAEVRPEQAALLLLKRLPEERRGQAIADHSFTAAPRAEATKTLLFPLAEIAPGAFLVRLQVEGAQSRLELDTDAKSATYGQYLGPRLEIP
jgi:hypothetical protein